jgi:hypothetical protein
VKEMIAIEGEIEENDWEMESEEPEAWKKKNCG